MISKAQQRAVSLSNADWHELDTALPDLIEMIADVRDLFSMVAWADGLDKVELRSVMRLACRAVQSFEAKEVSALNRLDAAIRHAKKEETAA